MDRRSRAVGGFGWLRAALAGGAALLGAAALGVTPAFAAPGTDTARTGASSVPRCTYTTQLGVQYHSVTSVSFGPPHAVGMAVPPTGPGYWITTDHGDTFTCNRTSSWGSWITPGSPGPPSPVVGEAANQSGGLDLVTASGVVGLFGHGSPHGSIAPGTALNAPIVGMAIDPATGGYWLVAADGGVFSFAAPFYGSMGGTPLNQPIVGMAATKDGGGYWLVAADGGVFAFGDAPFEGSAA